MLSKAAPIFREKNSKLRNIFCKTSLHISAFSLATLLLFQGDDNVPIWFFRAQDVSIILLDALALLLLSSYIPTKNSSHRPDPSLVAIILGSIVFTISAAGTWCVFGDFPLSRDEVLANFDADNFRRGELIAAIPIEWRPFSVALMPDFMLPVPAEFGWLSGYLPVNALIRTASDLLIGKEWANPFLATVAVFLVFLIASDLWPIPSRVAIVPTVLIATSPQLLTMAMTPYAMTGHLALNMLWLWCFLRNSRGGDISAIAVGFAATGLHQYVFHPLFAAPFLGEIILNKRFRRVTVYMVSYLLICLFWISYKHLVILSYGPDSAARQLANLAIPGFFEQITNLLSACSPLNLVLTVLNLLRLFSWQHVLLIPLAILSWPAVSRADGIARPLLLGIVLTLSAVIVLMPYQGHGWGYRYLHGCLGSISLLAGYGWQQVITPLERLRRNFAFVATTILTSSVIIPLHFYQAYQFTRPYREAYDAITRSSTDLVLVDPTGLAFARDLVRNNGNVSNSPKIMDVGVVDDKLIRELCNRYTIAIFDYSSGVCLGIRAWNTPDLSGSLHVLDKSSCQKKIPFC